MKPKLRALVQNRSFLLHILPTVVVLLAFLSVTVWAYVSAQDSLERERAQRILTVAETTQGAIEKRLALYEEVLRGGAGLFTASSAVTQADWSEYLSQFELKKRYPGVQAIGYTEVLAPAEVGEFINRMRQDGVRDFTIRPMGERDIYTAIKYISPVTDRNRGALGYDMFSEATRRKAMEQARDTGQIYYTSKVTLVQEEDPSKSAGFIMYIPIYERGAKLETVEDRRDALKGYIYAPFRSNDLLYAIFDNEEEQTFGFRIYSGRESPEHLLYENEAYETVSQNSAVEHRDTIKLNGSDWIVSYTFTGDIVPEAFRNRPYSVLGAGILLSGLAASLIYALLTARARSLVSTKEKEVQSAKDDLLSLASHQLRTPATGVKQYIGMVLEGYAGSLKDQQRMYLEKAYESNERQLHIINDLLYVAKADAGRIVLAKRAVRLKELIRDIVAEQLGSAKEANVAIRLRLPAKERTVYADKHCLRMAIENLLSNAIKYTPSGGKVRITVAEEGGNMLITVKDTGIGISDQDIGLLFNRFSRIPNSLSSQTNGSGIGLYLARSLVELHGGKITVASKEGKGTAFTIHMPIKG